MYKPFGVQAVDDGHVDTNTRTRSSLKAYR